MSDYLFRVLWRERSKWGRLLYPLLVVAPFASFRLAQALASASPGTFPLLAVFFAFAVAVAAVAITVMLLVVIDAHKLDTAHLQEQRRATLARLRTAGVEIRNLGQRGFNDLQEETRWAALAERWNTDAIRSIREISLTDAEWFSTLDVVPEPRLSIFGKAADHTFFLYTMHDFRLVKLEQLILKIQAK